MSSRATAAKPSLLSRIIAGVQARRPDADHAAIAALTRALFSKEGDLYAHELGEDGAIELAAHAFEFFADGGPVPRATAFTLPAAEGDANLATVLETVMPDRPFIVDTIRMCLRAEGVEAHHLLHPLLTTVRAEGPGPGM